MDKLNYDFLAETGCIIAKTDNHHDFKSKARVTENEQIYKETAVLEYIPDIIDCNFLTEDDFLKKYIWKYSSAADAKGSDNIAAMFDPEIIQNYEIKQIYRPSNEDSPSNFDNRKSQIHRKLDEMGIKDDIFFVSDIRHTNEFDDLLAIDNEITNRKFYWVKNAQTEFDPMDKTKELKNKTVENKKFIFCWEKYDPNNYTVYPEWPENKENNSKERITEENKEIMFYSNRRIYMAMQPTGKTSKDIYDNYKSSILITYPKSGNYAYADKNMATVSSHLIKADTNINEYNEYQNKGNQFKKILLEFYKTNLNHIKQTKIANFNNSNKYLAKRLGDAGQALSCLKNKVIFQKYVNNKVEDFESTNLFAFITWDKVCLASSLIYKVPILVYSFNDTILLFVRKDLLNPKELLDQYYNNKSIEKYIRKITDNYIGNDKIIINYNTFQRNIEKLNNFVTFFKMDDKLQNNSINLDENLFKLMTIYNNIKEIIIKIKSIHISNDSDFNDQGIKQKIIDTFLKYGFDIKGLLAGCIQDTNYNNITEVVFKNYKEKNISIENYNEVIKTDRNMVNDILGELTNILNYYNNIIGTLEYVNTKIGYCFNKIIKVYVPLYKISTSIKDDDIFNLDYEIDEIVVNKKGAINSIKEIIKTSKNKADKTPYNTLCLNKEKKPEINFDNELFEGYNNIIEIFGLFVVNKYNITLYNNFIEQIEIFLQKLEHCANDKKYDDLKRLLNIIRENLSEMGFKKRELSNEKAIQIEKVIPQEKTVISDKIISSQNNQNTKNAYYAIDKSNIREGTRRRGGALYDIMDVNNDTLSKNISMLKEFDLFLKGFMMLLIVIWTEGYMITNDLESDKLIIKIIYFYLTRFDIDIVGNYQLNEIEKDVKKIIQEYNDGNINFIYNNHYEDVIYSNKFTLNNLNINKCVYNYVNCIDERITQDMKNDVEDFFNLSKNKGFNDILLPPLSNKPENRNEQSSPIQKTLFPFPEEMSEFINNIFLSGEIITIINTIHNKLYNIPLSSDKLSNNNLIQNIPTIRTGHSTNENNMNGFKQKEPKSVFSFGGKKTRHYNKKISRNYRIKKNKTKRRNNKTRKS